MSHGCPSTRARMDFLQYHSLKSRNAKLIDDLNLTKPKPKSYMFKCYILEQNNGKQNSANYFCRNIKYYTYDELKKNININTQRYY